jgi:DNA-binding NtrC family response regulator
MTYILVIDDDKMLCRSMQLQLEAHNFKTETAFSGKEGFEKIKTKIPSIVFLDYHLPDITGLELLKKIHKKYPALPVVLVTGRQDMEIVIEAMKLNALDYLRKPVDFEDILILIEKVKLQKYTKTEPIQKSDIKFLGNKYEIIGKSKAITETLKQIGLLALNNIPVLITGESGTGKELVARALHKAMNPEKPFIAVNASAMPENLIESELFGSEKGSFTGADKTRTGKLESASDGVFFFDEVSETPMDFQVKLLRVLQEKEFERIGSVKKIPLKARIISASNKDLQQLIKDGKFREDLFYRLSVAEIKIPPLRERVEDIPILANYFIEKHKNLRLHPLQGITEKAINLLKSYDFPGNVRQLENIIIRTIINCKNQYIDESDLKKEITLTVATPEKILTLKEMEKNYITYILNYTDWNITKTSKILEIAPNTLRKKISDYNILKNI